MFPTHAEDAGARPLRRARGLWGMTARSSAAVTPSSSGQPDEHAAQQDSRTAEAGKSRQVDEASSSGRGAVSMSEARRRFQVWCNDPWSHLFFDV